MKFSVQDKLLSNTYMETFNLARELKFDGVEISVVGEPLNSKITKEIISASNKTGIVPSAICGGYRNWIGDFEHEKRLIAIKDIITSLEYASEMNSVGLIMPAAFGMFSRRLPPFSPPRDQEEDQVVLVDSLTKIAEFAEKKRINVFLEPLNRYEDHMINTVKQAVDLIELVGSERIKVIADFFHMSIEEEKIEDTICKYSNYIGYYHLADSNRLQPGMGHSNFELYLGTVQKTGYKGFLSFECGIHGNSIESLYESLNFLKSLVPVKLQGDGNNVGQKSKDFINTNIVI
ncbi:sugar phosphate isomerase/epimerase family protein [Lederbergia citri]|uniref:Sugar phosphate isomerase/epimerase n=1 Tax=Lederbergia citri TaxID=2833580 RepID=A0A942TD42_9BACI|nr:sugar phosphate isomerase/epimerase family protein [Lederbergia citri]MBS4195701.1 sugar phosphate isomerase/epimerase [Lederbergia citri]